MERTAGCRGRIVKFNIMIVFVLILTAVWCFCGCSENKEQAASMSPVVRIDLGSSTASGVVYERTEEELVIVTAGHVLKKHYPGEEHFSVKVVFGEVQVSASEVFLSETSETAFITIPLPAIPEEILKNCQMAARDQKRFDQLKEDDAIVLKGFSADGELLEISGTLVYSWIYAEDFTQYMMLVAGESFPGMSGGGVFDETGNLVGVLCGVNDSGESAAVPLSIIVAEYMQAYPDAGQEL